MEIKPSLTPFEKAQQARTEIKKALEGKTSIELQLPFPVAACILGLPEELFKKFGFSALIKNDKNGLNFLVADSEEIALQVFRNWQEDENPKIVTQFQEIQYLSLYRLIQAIKINQGNKIIKGVERLILKLLEEDDQRFQGLCELISQNKPIPEEDLQALHITLTQIWENLPISIRSKISSFNPNNVFNA